MNKIPVILDVDLGVDDACAVLLALKSERLAVIGVTTTFGNRQLWRTNRNTIAFLEFVGRSDVPVAQGSSQALVRDCPEYEDEGPYVVHGKEGLGYASIPHFSKKNVDLKAEDFIAECARNSHQKITLIPVGPLTNIAKFILKYPELHDKIEQISIMGGGINKGNITDFAEVNIFFDAEAAKIVFESGIPIILSPLDATHQAYITKDEREQIKSIKNIELSELMFQALDFYGNFYETIEKAPGCVLHDSLAVIAVAYPEYLEFETKTIEIIVDETQYGRTKISNSGNICKVVSKVNRNEFIRLFFESLN